MNKDRFLFDPCVLALVKAFVYLLAFFTTILLDEKDQRIYYSGIIVYCCGCLCDYIEIAAYRTDKCSWIRKLAGVIAVLLGLVTISAIAICGYYDSYKRLVDVLNSNRFWLNLFFALFWAIPLGCGLRLMFSHIGTEDKNQSSEKLHQHAIGYRVKP